MYAIFDLDNTIADDAWRIKNIDWSKAHPFERYHPYHMLSAFDRLGNEELLSGLPSDTQIVVFTARPEFYSSITQEWLERNNVAYELLLMRPNDDHAHSLELKKRQLYKFLENWAVDPSEVHVAYDDREDVVQMYRQHDIHAIRAPIHNVCAYTNPRRA